MIQREGVAVPGIEPCEGKPGVNRLIATTRGEPTDRVPNFEIPTVLRDLAGRAVVLHRGARILVEA